MTKETFAVRLWALRNVFLLYFVKPSIVEVNERRCEIVIPLNWRTRRRDIGAMYLGTLCMGADVASGLIKNLDDIMPMIDDDTKLIAGHGALSDKKALNEWTNMLKGTVAIMNEAMAKGKTLEEVKTEKTLVAWSNWDQGFMNLEKYEEQLYRELTKK